MARAKGRHWVALWLVAFLVTRGWYTPARPPPSARPASSAICAAGAPTWTGTAPISSAASAPPRSAPCSSRAPRRGSVCTCRATARSSWSLLPAGRASAVPTISAESGKALAYEDATRGPAHPQSRQVGTALANGAARGPHPGGGIRGARGPGFARGTRGAGADPPRSPLGGGGAGAAYRADRAAGAPRHAVRPPRHTARRDPGDLPRGHRAQRAARPDRRRRAHQSPARLDGACLATGAAPPVRLLRGPVQRARGAAPAECTGRASRAGAQPVLSRSRRRARDHRPPGGRRPGRIRAGADPRQPVGGPG